MAMPQTIDISLTGISEVIQQLTQARIRAENLQPCGYATALVIGAEVDQVFDQAPSTTSGGMAYNGVYWKALSDAYLQRRQKYRAGRGRGVVPRDPGQLLRDTGALLQSLTVQESGAMGKKGILEIDRLRLTYGTALAKAGRLNRDRPFLVITPKMVEAVRRVWERYIMTGQV